MSTERADLIAAIRESPDDDDLRLVCADWFEEQGDEANVARADFIRTQIERARLPDDDVRQSELEARELRLLKRWGPVWCGSHFVFKKVIFRRGFIDYVHLHLRHFQHHRRQLFALEPVRDVRLTGWHRAPTDLVRRVAACAEWKYVETLRIHHQGPHKDPGSDVVLLLESPHLTRLRGLHCPLVAFGGDARRRFERLPVLRQIRELQIPTLDTLMRNPGEWFYEGGAEFADQWTELKSLTFPHILNLVRLRLFTERAFWPGLEAITLQLPYETSEALALLRDRMPESLRELTLSAGLSPADYSAAPSFFERLAQTPLRSLHLHEVPITAPALGRFFDGTGRAELRELTLTSDALTRANFRVLAEAPRTSGLRSLNLYGWNQSRGLAEILFASEHLRSLVHLSMHGIPIRKDAAAQLAEAGGWDRLRSLNLSGLGTGELRVLLESPNLQRLTWLAVRAGGWRGVPSLSLPPDVATALTRLPHLAGFRFDSGRCDPRSREILAGSPSLVWKEVIDLEEGPGWPGRWGPDVCPPTDAGVEWMQALE
jgi:uncharacterized protein (TIGR02996 family)